MTDAEIETFARDVIESIAAGCHNREVWADAIKAQPVIVQETGNIEFHFSTPTRVGTVTARLDPLPFITNMIKLFVENNVPLNKHTFFFITFETLRRWAALVVNGTVEAAFGAMAHIQPHRARKAIQTMLSEQHLLYFGFDVDKRKGRRRDLSPDGERIAFQAITDSVPIFSKIRDDLLELRHMWEDEQPNTRKGKDHAWRGYLKTVVVSRDYPQYKTEAIVTLFDVDVRKRNPTYAACVHLHKFFECEVSTLYKRYGEREEKD